MRVLGVLLLIGFASLGCESKGSAKVEAAPEPEVEESPRDNPKTKIGKANKKLRDLKKDTQGTMDAREGNISDDVERQK